MRNDVKYVVEVMLQLSSRAIVRWKYAAIISKDDLIENWVFRVVKDEMINGRMYPRVTIESNGKIGWINGKEVVLWWIEEVEKEEL